MFMNVLTLFGLARRRARAGPERALRTPGRGGRRRVRARAGVACAHGRGCGSRACRPAEELPATVLAAAAPRGAGARLPATRAPASAGFQPRRPGTPVPRAARARGRQARALHLAVVDRR